LLGEPKLAFLTSNKGITPNFKLIYLKFLFDILMFLVTNFMEAYALSMDSILPRVSGELSSKQDKTDNNEFLKIELNAHPKRIVFILVLLGIGILFGLDADTGPDGGGQQGGSSSYGYLLRRIPLTWTGLHGRQKNVCHKLGILVRLLSLTFYDAYYFL
jgi:hypothetical protein